MMRSEVDLPQPEGPEADELASPTVKSTLS
jgi:hypothetical protein